MQHRIILPGATTLTRLISEVREKATLRLWNKLALIPSAEQRSQLEMLLGPTDCSRLSLLESLKKGPVTISGPAFNEAIERWKTLNDFGLHAENLSTLPAVRLKNLARYAGMTSVIDGVIRKEKLLIEAPVNGGRNYNGPKVAKFLVG